MSHNYGKWVNRKEMMGDANPYGGQSRKCFSAFRYGSGDHVGWRNSSQKKGTRIHLFLWIVVLIPTIGMLGVNENNEVATSSARQLHSNEILRKIDGGGFSGLQIGFVPPLAILVSDERSPLPPENDSSYKKVGSTLVGSIMALLATFDDARALPPEGTSRANQLIHGLIQLQSALVKSNSSELKEYVLAAITSYSHVEENHFFPSIAQSGLTSYILAALSIHNKKMPMWNQPGLPHVFQRYNLTQRDWELIDRVFFQAEEAYRIKGSSIHLAYQHWRTRLANNP